MYYYLQSNKSDKKKNKILKKQKILISIGRLDKQKNFAQT